MCLTKTSFLLVLPVHFLLWENLRSRVYNKVDVWGLKWLEDSRKVKSKNLKNCMFFCFFLSKFPNIFFRWRKNNRRLKTAELFNFLQLWSFFLETLFSEQPLSQFSLLNFCHLEWFTNFNDIFWLDFDGLGFIKLWFLD